MFKIIPILFILILSVNFIYAQEYSLKEQLQNDIPFSEIQCFNSQHVLVERPNGKVACVYFDTADKLEWKIINNDTSSIFELVKDDMIFDINYDIKGGIITDMIHSDKNTLFVMIDSSNDGEITLYIPHGVIDPIPKDSGDNFLLVLVNGEEGNPDQFTNNELDRTITLKFPHPDPEIEIISANWK